jgi:hypothetical protein
MFDSHKASAHQHQETPDQAKDEPPKKHEFSVHTMPSKFHASGPSELSSGGFSTPSSKKSNTGKIVLIVVSVVVVLGLAVIGYLFYQRSANETAANANTNAGNENDIQLNININRNTNANKNSNGNANTNASNGNTNGNANATNGNTNTAVTPLAQIPSSQDLDADGLTDVEEIDYKTTKTDNDSDDDTFLDGTEVRLGYSPLGKGKLEGTESVRLYQNTVYGFSFLYPADWSIQRRGENQGVILLSPAGTEYIDVSIQDNVARLTPEAWYEKNNPGFATTALTTIQSWDKKVNGIKSPDGYSAHFGSGNYIFTFYYNLQGKKEADYKMTLDMVTLSIGLLPISSISNGNYNTNGNSNSNSNTNSSSNANTNSNQNTNTNSNVNVNGNANTNTNSNSNTNSNTN